MREHHEKVDHDYERYCDREKYGCEREALSHRRDRKTSFRTAVVNYEILRVHRWLAKGFELQNTTFFITKEGTSRICKNDAISEKYHPWPPLICLMPWR